VNKREAADLLGISPSTLQRRVASGRYSCTRVGEGQYAVLEFSYADIGLPEPIVPVNVVVPEEPEPSPAAPVIAVAVVAPPEPEEPLREWTADEEFARAYLAGEIPDSLGNFHGQKTPTALLNKPSGPSSESQRDLRFAPISFQTWDGLTVNAMAHRRTRNTNKRTSGWGGKDICE